MAFFMLQIQSTPSPSLLIPETKMLIVIEFEILYIKYNKQLKQYFSNN